jgi:hypothetical protein
MKWINERVTKSPRRSALLFAVIVFCITQTGAMAQPVKIIYFMAGAKDHAWPSRHETEKDLLVLQRCLDSVSNIRGVKIVTRFIYKRTAVDIDDMKDAAAIVIESSAEYSSKERTHPLFPPNENKKTYDKDVLNYLDQVDSLHKAGMGIVVLHWAVAAENHKALNLYTNWFGGGYVPGFSQNPLGMWTITKFMVVPGDPRRTDLLMGEAPKTNMGPVAPRLVTWAYEDGKARALMYGGMDYHSALLQENYRRFLLNAIVWAAGIEVPKGGVKSEAKGLQLVASRPDQFDNMK